MSQKNKIYFQYLITLFFVVLIKSCGIYSFTGASIPAGTETFQVNYFDNIAGNRPGSTIEPGLDRDFTLALQDILINQTNLNLTNTNGDLVFEGEIIEYGISPMSATAENTAAQNRLTITVNVDTLTKKRRKIIMKLGFLFFMTFLPNNNFMILKTPHMEKFSNELHKIFLMPL